MQLTRKSSRLALAAFGAAMSLAACAGLSKHGAGARIAPGETCDPAGPQLLDGDLKPIDLEKPEQLELAAGHPVLACVTLTQALHGRVIDQATRAPVVGALISVKAWQSPTPSLGQHVPRDLVYTQETTTDDAGHWTLPSTSQWMAGMLAADGLPFVGSTQCIHAEGYEVVIIDPWRRASDVNPDLSQIALTRGRTLGCP